MTTHFEESTALWDTTAASSAFDPEDWISWCEATTGQARPTFPPRAVLTVLPELFEHVLQSHGGQSNDFTMPGNPFVVVDERGRDPWLVSLTTKGSGASGILEHLIALGSRSVVFVGGCGLLLDDAAVGSTVVPASALRDEGVSNHYLPPGRYADASPGLADALARSARTYGLEPIEGPVWTTTAHFRQARPRLEAFRDEGCVAVTNEAASLFAVGTFRRVSVAALLVATDSIADGRFVIPPDTPGPPPATLLDVALGALRAEEAA